MYGLDEVGSDTFVSYWPHFAYCCRAVRTVPFPFWSFEIGIGASIFSFAGYLMFDAFNILLFALSESSALRPRVRRHAESHDLRHDLLPVCQRVQAGPVWSSAGLDTVRV